MSRKILSLLCDGKVGTFHRPRTGEPVDYDHADHKEELGRSPPPMPYAGSIADSFIGVPLTKSIPVSPNRYCFFCHSSGGLPLYCPS